MSHELFEQIQAQQPIERMAGSKSTKENINKIRATFAGKSRLQQGSTRAKILLAIQKAPNNQCTIAELEDKFNMPVRGYIHKLLGKNHIVMVEEK